MPKIDIAKMKKASEGAVSSEWQKMAKKEAQSFEKADLTSLQFFAETRENINSEVDHKGMVLRMNNWIDLHIESKGVSARLKKIVKLAFDSIEAKVGDPESTGDKLHVKINMELIHFYNLEQIIKIKKLMDSQMAKPVAERAVSGTKIKEAQKVINSAMSEEDKTAYNNALVDAISEAKKLLGVEESEELKISKKVENFEKFLKTVGVEEAGRIIAQLSKDMAEWKKELRKKASDDSGVSEETQPEAAEVA